MILIHEAGAAAILVALTLCLQSAGMAVLIGWARTRLSRSSDKFQLSQSAMLMVHFTTAILTLHFVQILLWAAFYRWRCFPFWESAFYFSTTSYTTVGYGDVVLPQTWRTLGPVESIMGVLMCGLSVSVLFTIVHRLVDRTTHSMGGLNVGDGAPPATLSTGTGGRLPEAASHLQNSR